MAQGKQAKIFTAKQITLILKHLETTRYPLRDQVIFLLSVKAGLRAKEIASLTWHMVMDSNGGIGDSIFLEDKASKGKSGRTIPLNSELRKALLSYQTERKECIEPERPLIFSERGLGMSEGAMRVWFHKLFQELGFTGYSSHSGRRTFITMGSRKIIEAGGSLRDIQQLAGHKSLTTTQAYIEGDNEAKRKVIEMI